jgi:hypothetical protein
MGTRSSEDLKEQPWVDVLKTLAEELRDFIQQEMQLVKVELSSKAKKAGVGAGMFGAAGFMGVMALGTLTAAIILALALVMPAWAAALVVTAFYGIVAGVLALAGKKKVKAAMPLAPEQTLRTVQVTKEQLQQAWERGSHQAQPSGLRPTPSPSSPSIGPSDGGPPATQAAEPVPPGRTPGVQNGPQTPGVQSGPRTSFPRY